MKLNDLLTISYLCILFGAHCNTPPNTNKNAATITIASPSSKPKPIKQDTFAPDSVYFDQAKCTDTAFANSLLGEIVMSLTEEQNNITFESSGIWFPLFMDSILQQPAIRYQLLLCGEVVKQVSEEGVGNGSFLGLYNSILCKKMNEVPSVLELRNVFTEKINGYRAASPDQAIYMLPLLGKNKGERIVLMQYYETGGDGSDSRMVAWKWNRKTRKWKPHLNVFPALNHQQFFVFSKDKDAGYKPDELLKTVQHFYMKNAHTKEVDKFVNSLFNYRIVDSLTLHVYFHPYDWLPSDYEGATTLSCYYKWNKNKEQFVLYKKIKD